MNIPPATSAWWRDKILPVIVTAAMVGTFASGLAGWKELAILNVKVDSRFTQIDDHEVRIRELERKEHEQHP